MSPTKAIKRKAMKHMFLTLDFCSSDSEMVDALDDAVEMTDCWDALGFTMWRGPIRASLDPLAIELAAHVGSLSDGSSYETSIDASRCRSDGSSQIFVFRAWALFCFVNEPNPDSMSWRG